MYTKILSNVTSIFYTNRHAWRPAIEQLIESLDLAANDDPLTSLNAIFIQAQGNPWTATSRDFETWLRTTHELEPEALPEPVIVQPEPTVVQPVVDTVVAQATVDTSVSTPNDTSVSESIVSHSNDHFMIQMSQLTEDERAMVYYQLGVLKFDRNNIILPSGKVSSATYYRRLQDLTAKLNSI